MVGSVQRPGHRLAGWLAGWLGCVFWALVSILFKPGPRPQTSRKPFITLRREGNVGKNQADHVAPSLATESWPASSLLLQSPRPDNTHWHLQTASTPLGPSSSHCHSFPSTVQGLFHLQASAGTDPQTFSSIEPFQEIPLSNNKDHSHLN